MLFWENKAILETAIARRIKNKQDNSALKIYITFSDYRNNMLM